MDPFKIIIDDLNFNVEFATSAIDLVKQEYNKIDHKDLKLFAAKLNAIELLYDFGTLNNINHNILEPLFEQIINVEL
jgi:hypothetical protein